MGAPSPPLHGRPPHDHHALSASQIEALGLPASPEEARAYLIRTAADTVPHGDHVDFIVGDRLIHVVTGDGHHSEHCGADCADSSPHEPALVDHDELDVARKRVGSEHGNGDNHGGGRYVPLARAEAGASLADARAAIDAAFAHDHAGGEERPRTPVFAWRGFVARARRRSFTPSSIADRACAR